MNLTLNVFRTHGIEEFSSRAVKFVKRKSYNIQVSARIGLGYFFLNDYLGNIFKCLVVFFYDCLSFGLEIFKL